MSFRRWRRVAGVCSYQRRGCHVRSEILALTDLKGAILTSGVSSRLDGRRILW